MLDSATARSLGYEQVTLRAGDYPVDYSVNPHGQVSVNATSQGIVIGVLIARAKYNCESHFGACLVIRLEDAAASASARTIPAGATWVNGRLQLDFLAEPPDKTNVFTIDQDIVLDSATAQTLGYEHVPIHAGDYPVDYSANPFGQVTVSTAAQGIIIWVEIGRTSRGCHGFGICAGGIELNSTTAIQATAALVNGRLQMSFLSDPTDKTNLLVIDQDVVLDTPTSRLLGYDQVTLRAGQYPVDYSLNPHGQVILNPVAQGLIIWVQIGRASQGCAGFGICRGGFGPPPDTMSIPATAAWVNGRLQLDFLSDPPEKGTLLALDADVVLDTATSRLLGYDQVTLRAGQYPVDYSTNAFGQVTLNTLAQGVTITVKVGRPSNGCNRGFGLCIIVDLDMTRAVQASAAWSNGRLQLNFLSEPPDKTNVLVLEQDVPLDTATSHQLGYDQVTLRAGPYPVDFTANPNGQVSLTAAARGPIIWVEIGRQSKGCRGFGICRGGVEAATDRGVQAVADWVNGNLQMRFLADPPDKGTLLIVEQDVVLDSATSQLLGHGQAILRAGQYPVDYSTNASGQVGLKLASTDRLNPGTNPDGTRTLTWPGTGWKLQTANNLLGPWTDAPVQVSPAPLAPGGSNQFYRLIKP